MVLETIGAAGVIFKAKYVKRTGSPGKYKYWYRNPKTGKLQAGKQPAKKPSKELLAHVDQMQRHTDKKEERMVKLQRETAQKVKVIRAKRSKAAEAIRNKFDYFRKRFDEQRKEISKSERIQFDALHKDMDDLEDFYGKEMDALREKMGEKEDKIKQM